MPVLIERPDLVANYRRRIRDLGQDALASETKQRMRELVDLVRIQPAKVGWAIEVIASPGAVLEMATDQKRKGQGWRSVQLVAEEGLEPPTRGL